MREFNQEWLVRRAAAPGTLACGLRGPDGVARCHSLEEICSVNRMEKILAQFEGIRSAVFSDALAPRWSTWTFERGLIRLVQRPDQWLLGLVVQFDSEAAFKLDGVCQEFLVLDL
jgi:hypothetical protein